MNLPNPGPLPNSLYVVGCTPESGAGVLLARMSQYGELGASLPILCGDRPQEMPAHDIGVLKARTSAAGVFGITCDWHGFDRAMRLDGLAKYGWPPKLFVLLRRDDFVEQAVSLTIRLLKLSSPAGVSALHPPVYCRESTRRNASLIMRQEYEWASFIRISKVTTLRIFYEELVSDIDAVVTRIARSLGVPAQAPQLQRGAREGADTIMHDWRARFADEEHDFVTYWEEYRGRRTP